MNRILLTDKLHAPYIDEFTVTSPIEECVRLLEEGASQSRWLSVRDYHIHITKIDSSHYTFKMRIFLHPARLKSRYYYDVIGTMKRVESGTHIKSEIQIIKRTRLIMQIWLFGWVTISGCGVVAGVSGVIVGLPTYGGMLILFASLLLLGLGGSAAHWQHLDKTRIEAANILRYMLHG